MPEENNNWVKIAEHISEIDFGANNIAEREVGGKKMCLAKFNDMVFAFAAVCPHAGGVLTEGCINVSGHIVCPVHSYKFNMRTGHNVSGEGYHLKHWPVAMRADGVFVAIEGEEERRPF